jgi:hypothetical protein
LHGSTTTKKAPSNQLKHYQTLKEQTLSKTRGKKGAPTTNKKSAKKVAVSSQKKSKSRKAVVRSKSVTATTQTEDNF